MNLFETFWYFFFITYDFAHFAGMHHYGMLCLQYACLGYLGPILTSVHWRECAFMSHANSGIDAVMIECTLCGQWVDDACARIDAKKIKEEDPYLCGCDRIDNGKFVIKRYVFCYIKLNLYYNEVVSLISFLSEFH